MLSVQCDQRPLQQALKACLRLAKLDPFLSGCTLIAQAPPLWPTAKGQLLVRAWSDRAEAGVLTEISVLVAREGTLSLPFQPLTDIVASLQPGEVQVWHGQVTAINALAPMKEGSPPGFLAEAVLVVERGTTTRSHCSRVRALTPAEQALQGDWGGLSGPVLSLGQVSVKQWRQALAPCLLLTREHAVALETTSEMDHSQVLIRFEPTHLSLVAATRYDVVQTTLPFRETLTAAPFTHAQFSGDVLDRLGQMLIEDPGPLTLQVVNNPPRVDLLIKTSTGMTMVCRGTLDRLPLVWEHPFRLAAQLETRVERKDFMQACASLAIAKHHPDWNGLIRFQITQAQYVLSLVIGDEEIVRREVPLLDEVPDMGPVWVHLTRLRHLLAQLTASELILQWLKYAPNNPLPLDCLRLSSAGEPQRMFMMMLSNIATDASQPTQPVQEVASV